MKLIAIEEHFLTNEIKQQWKNGTGDDPTQSLHQGDVQSRLTDMGNTRLSLMDETGIDVQVLSLTSPSLHNLGAASVELAKQTNNFLAEIVSKTPDRFEGFAALPMPMPEEVPKELERAVNTLGMKGAMLCGRTGEKNMDAKEYWPMFEAAEALGIPLFIHPQIPQKSVREAYYSGFSNEVDLAFSTYGIGWHYEAGIQFVRLILAGVFDHYPKLQIILRHWGEVVLFYIERLASLNRTAKLQRPLIDYVKQNLYVTSSGMFSPDYLQRAIDIIGIDRILFSQDYPYQYRSRREARNFLEAADLSNEDKEKFAFKNWENLTGISKR